MRRGEAASRDEDVRGVAHHERPVRDAHRLAVGQVVPQRVRAGMVILDRRAAQADLVIELAGAQHVLARQARIAVDAPRLADPDLGPERHERRVLVARHQVDEEADVLEGLTTAGDLGPREEVRIRRVDRSVRPLPGRVETGHDRGRHARDRRDVIAPLAARQVVSAGSRRFPHQGLELLPRDGAPLLVVDVHHPEGGRQGLGRVELTRQFVPEPPVMGEVRIAARIDEDAGADPAQPRLGRHQERFDTPVADLHLLEERVEQDPCAGVLHESFPDHLEVLREIGDSGPGAVGVGPLHDGPERAQASDHIVADAADDLDGAFTGRVEAVERVKHGRAVPAQERKFLDEDDGGAGPRCGNRRARPCGSGAHDTDVDRRDDRMVTRQPRRAGHGTATAAEAVTDQPPSILSSCPVTARDSSERK